LSYQPIDKDLREFAVPPNLRDYDALCASFKWDDVRTEMAGLPRDRGLNIAWEAVGRHARSERAQHVAIRWLGKSGQRQHYTYEDLERATNRFANVLAHLKIEKEDRVFSLVGRIPALYVAALGTLKHRAVFCPLFEAFGPDPVIERLHRGGGRVLVTTRRLYERKIASRRESLEDLQHVLIADVDAGEGVPDGTTNLVDLMAHATDDYTIGPTDPEDMALLHFTSGTTGAPKGAIHVHEAVLMHYITAKYALGLHPDDCFWCTADPGWVTGTSYGIIAPLVHGVTARRTVAQGDGIGIAGRPGTERLLPASTR